MARTYTRKPDTKPSNHRSYVARFDRSRPVDVSLLSKAFVALAQAAVELEAQEEVPPKKGDRSERIT